MIHCCFPLPWSPLSQLQLPSGLLPVALPEVGAHTQLWCCGANGRTRYLQVPEKLQLPLFALPHSLPWGNALGGIKFVGPTRGKMRLLDCIIRLVRTGFQRRKNLVILNWYKLTLKNHQQTKTIMMVYPQFSAVGQELKQMQTWSFEGNKSQCYLAVKVCFTEAVLCVISNKCTTRGQGTSLKD